MILRDLCSCSLTCVEKFVKYQLYIGPGIEREEVGFEFDLAQKVADEVRVRRRQRPKARGIILSAFIKVSVSDTPELALV